MTEQLSYCIETARLAGEAILTIYNQDFEVITKEDNSPLTQADRNANEVILERLTSRWPEIPFISEETKLVPYQERKNWNRFWLIDPLDGTKEFVKKNGEFTVNIALVEQGIPVLGVVYAPAFDVLYYAEKGFGAWKQEGNNPPVQIGGKPHYSNLETIVVVGSRSHLSEETLAFVERLTAQGKEVTFRSSGSSLKICLVAEGAADVYPRLGPTMEWDTAAAHAVALIAGRQVLDFKSQQALVYNKPDLLNPWFVVE